MSSATGDSREIVVEVALRPNDVDSPFRWDAGNLWRWVTAIVICLIFIKLFRDSSALLSFPGGKSILAIVILLTGLILCGLLVFPYLRVRAVFRRSPALTKPRRYTFRASGVAVQSDDVNSDLKWSLFQRVVETRAVFAFFASSHQATYVPKRCFSSPDDVARMRELIRENMSGKSRLRGD